MWRGGAATIWQKPEQSASQAWAQASLLAPASVNRLMEREEYDPYRGWSTPIELGPGSNGSGGLSVNQHGPTEPLALTIQTLRTGSTDQGSVPVDWFQSSDDEDKEEEDGTKTGAMGAPVVDLGAPSLAVQRQLTSMPMHRHQPPAPQYQSPELDKEREDQDRQKPATNVSLYEDWYYEKRPMLRGTPVPDLASCSTTTGGIQVCRNAARHWVYPAHIPERKYQLHAISRALFSNTLVCYPTGLGKTLIAAVVMQNFFRWFPNSKVVFIAPTKPLVTQQMKACEKFMGLNDSAVMEITGRASGDNRKAGWNDERVRVYFCTPQAFWNDVKRGICPYEQISCVVVDECHRAVGQADIVKAIKDMRNSKKCKFRVLGLSATPGSSHEHVQEVIDALGISTLVFKDEEDKDVAPYVHNKRSEAIVVNPEYADNASRCMLMATLQRIVGDLSSRGHYFGPADAERVTRFGMQQAKRSCKSTSWDVSGKFIQAAVLADLRDQLDGYGPKTALSFLQGKMAQERHMKTLHSSDPQFAHFIGSLQRAQGSNPKVERLKQILHEFFSAPPVRGGPSSSVGTHAIRRAIIFASLRDGVATIAKELESMSPLVRAKMFIGQGGGKGQRGMKQDEQKGVLADFTSGACNLLVATCIGEEGLDIPNVDLIICFDAISSPTRALQRQGRTGRHGDGRVIYLLTAGQEEGRFNKAAEAMKRLHSQLKEADRFFTLNENAVRMLPREFGVPKMAHLVEDKDSTQMSLDMTDKTTGVGGGGGVFGTAGTALNIPPQITPRVALPPPGAQHPFQVTNATTVHHKPSSIVDLASSIDDGVEEMPLIERLQYMRARASGATDVGDAVGNAVRTAGDGVADVNIVNIGGADKRRRRIVSSQSTPSRSPAGHSLLMGDASSISLENLSIKKKTPQQLSRLCRAGDQKTVASKVNKKPRLADVGEVGVGGMGHAVTKNYTQKKRCAYLDDEASLSGEASGDERDDLMENPSLQDFFDDATQNDSPAVHYRFAGAGGYEESPGIMDMLARVRSRRQQAPMVDTQSQEFSRHTPDEYDRDDSFLADSDDEDL